MAENDLKVIVKAKELAVHSFKLTSNCNRYPKKYRHSLVDRIQNKSLEIFETLLEANRINNMSNKRERCETITKAITFAMLKRNSRAWRSWLRKRKFNLISSDLRTVHGKIIYPTGIATTWEKPWTTR